MSRRQLSVYPAAMGMDLSCLYVLLSLAYANPAPIVMILATYPLSFVVNSAAGGPGAVSRRGLALSAAAGAGMIVLIVALGLVELLANANAMNAGAIVGLAFQVVFCGLSWWLGYRLVDRKPDNREVMLHLQVGVLALLLLTMFGAAAFLAVVVFFGCALAAMAVSRWETTAARTTAVLKGFRPGATAFACAVIVAIGALASLFLSPELARDILAGLGAVGMFLSALLGLDKVRPPESKPMSFDLACNFKSSGESGIDTSPPPPDGSAGSTSPVVLWIIFMVVLLAVLALFFLVRRIVKRGVLMAPPGTPVLSERMSWNPFRDAAAALAGILARLKALAAALIRTVARRRGGSGEEGATSVRALYRRLLHWGAKRGRPRQPALTPAEYSRVLAGYFPDRSNELAEITEAYTEARYSRRPENTGRLDSARRAWARIRAKRL